MNKTSQTDTATVEYAGFWARVVAYMIDMIILGLLTIPINVVGLFVIGTTKGTQDQLDAVTGRIMLIAFGVCTIVAILYFSVFESLKPQATPGKMVMRVEVTDSNGKRVSFGRALARNLAKILSSIPFNIGFLMAAFTGRKQALHDMVTGCLVVKQHLLTETKWEATHHKHKTSWTDPRMRRADSSGQNPSPDQLQTADERNNQIGSTADTDFSKIDLAEVAARPEPAGAVRQPEQHKVTAEASTLPAPPPALPQTMQDSAAPQLSSTTSQPGSAPQLATAVPTPSPSQPETSISAPQSQASFLHADLSSFSPTPSVPADLGSLPSAESTLGAVSSTANTSQKICAKCGAVIDQNFSFCLSCMETY